MDKSKEDRARKMVSDLKQHGRNHGLFAGPGVVVILGPGGSAIKETPTFYDQTDLDNAIALDLVEKRRFVTKDGSVEVYVAR